VVLAAQHHGLLMLMLHAFCVAAACRWNAQDVAVKVIEHTESTLNAVEAEAALMLSLNHENIVRAYHFVTYTQQPQLTSTCSMGSSQGSRLRAIADKEIAEAAAVAAAAVSPGCCTSNDSAMDKATAVPTPARNSIGDCSSSQHIVTIAGPPQGSLGAVSISSRGSGGAGRLERANTTTSAWQSRPAKAETWLVQEFCDRGTLAEVAASWLPEAECEAQMLERLLLLLDAAK
jgi:serine/threonine protein kinase